MLIWFNLFIPIAAIVIMAVFFQKKMAWWEYFIIFLIPLIAIIIAKVASVYSQTQATEYWNTYLTHATYTEPWSTWVHKTCERCVKRDTTGSCVREEEYDCSYCDDNGPTWIAYDNMGKGYNISSAKFEELCKIWGKREFKELNRHIDHHMFCGKDGDEYNTSYDGVFSHLQPICFQRTYENRVKCSRSVFNFQKVDNQDKNTYGIYEYKPVGDVFHYDPIYGGNNDSASRQLSRWNALMGMDKQLQMNILVFKNQPLQAAAVQEAYWKRGNKNELILCVGVKNNTIEWTKVISWTDAELLKIKVERTVASMPYDLPAIVDTMAVYAGKMWVRKKFADFKYITVEPTPEAVLWAFILTLILTGGLCVFSVLNPFTLENPSGDSEATDFGRYRRRW